MLPVSMPGDAPRNPEPIGSCRPLVYPNLDDAHHGVKAAPPGPAAARRHKRLRSVASSKANMFAIADRRHPVVMLERPLVEQNTRLTTIQPGSFPFPCFFFALRCRSPVGLVRRREAGSEHYRQS